MRSILPTRRKAVTHTAISGFTLIEVMIAVAIVAIIAALVALQVKFDIFGKAVDGLKTGFNFLWSTVKTVFNWVVSNWPLLLAVITGPFSLAILAVSKFKNEVIAIFSTIYNGIKATMGFVADVITAPFKAAFRAVAGLWNNTIGKLSFTVPSWVPGFGGKGFDVPDIPVLGNGGIVTGPTLAMIGERGPEAVIPLNRAGGMGMGNNITVNVSSADPNAVVAALQQYIRDRGALPITVNSTAFRG
jgi:prepilin-type N-terminal cleavage/methylation domain-containing protein